MHGLGIDVGSTNAKVVIVSEAGELISSASRPLVTDVRGDVATQDPQVLWSCVAAAITEALGAAGPAAAQVGSIAVCSQYSSIVGVDSEGEPTSPLVTYLDQRGGDHCWAILDRHPESFEKWLERHGIPPVGAGLSLAHLLHLQHDEPDLHSATTDYLEVMDLVNLRLTGRAVATQSTMFASQLCDNRVLGVTEYDAELLAMSGVDPHRLPTLIEADGLVGTLTPEVAATLGLTPDVVVVAGMNDSHAAAFATGAYEKGRAGLVFGTTAVLLDTVDRVASDLEREVVSMPAPVPDTYLVMAENGLAGRSVEHALTELLSSPGNGGTDPFAEIPGAIQSSSPGAGGVLFLPWLAGSLSPSADRAMRGGFLGVTVETTRAEMVRATLEGTARNMRWLLPAVEDMSGHAITEFVFAGGAARSPQWAQCLSDVLGRPVSVPEHPETAAAQAVALVGLRRVTGHDITSEAAIAARFEPDPAATLVHDRLQGPFEESFTAVQAICHSLDS